MTGRSSLQFFDNRNEPLKDYDIYRSKRTVPVWKRLRYFRRHRLSPYFVGGDLHHAFTHDGQDFLYAYVRKNASTAFLNFLASKIPARLCGETEKIDYMHSFLVPRRRAQVEGSQCNFFVYRDPLDRLVSLFNNKFVQNPDLDHNIREGLILNFEHITQTRFGDTTFDSFVKAYLQRYFRLFSRRWLLDVHLRPQADCLWPICYTHVVRFEHLHEDFTVLLGKDTADEYFSNSVNSTSAKRHDHPSSRTPVSHLRRRFRETGQIPSQSAYLDEETEAIIRSLYSIDYDLGSLIAEQQ